MAEGGGEVEADGVDLWSGEGCEVWLRKGTWAVWGTGKEGRGGR